MKPFRKSLSSEEMTSPIGKDRRILFSSSSATFALEGSNLENVHGSYDPSKGNYLAFGVQGIPVNQRRHKNQPSRRSLCLDLSVLQRKNRWEPPLKPIQAAGAGEWLSSSTALSSAPLLSTLLLSDSAMITGSFTQREINQLEADLKAGSLSFTPHILSEKNVSPELGSKERFTRHRRHRSALCCS